MGVADFDLDRLGACSAPRLAGTQTSLGIIAAVTSRQPALVLDPGQACDPKMPRFAPIPSAASRLLRSGSLLMAAFAATLALAGCESARSWVPQFLQPYRPDVQQGNVVTKEMVDQLRQGMTRDQVRFLLGTPMLASVFHPTRWDYIYYLKRGKGDETQTRRLTVQFKDNRVDAFRADEMPPEALADNLILGREATKPPKKGAPTRESDPGENAPGPIYK
jgi:outer membrane protein assembly factor BamE